MRYLFPSAWRNALALPIQCAGEDLSIAALDWYRRPSNAHRSSIFKCGAAMMAVAAMRADR
jgi:hypothetical protein